MKKRLAVFGSTGSIGTQTLSVVAQHPKKYTVEVLTAHHNVRLLAQQAIHFQPNVVVVADRAHYAELKTLLSAHPIKVFAGPQALCEAAQLPSVDVVVSALVGIAGLAPTLSAIQARKTVALANKEVLVVAGQLVRRLVQEHSAAILPVDSEHSAIFQCLAGERSPIEKIYLTASGGPFLYTPAEELRRATKAQALRHPNWNMGAKVTIDSASMMNKGFEVIEACHLFGLTPKQVEVLVHPQSAVHSMVQFADGSLKAQLGAPDMRIPIAYALSYPERLKLDVPRFSFTQHPRLTFQQPDTEKFPCLALAYEALRRGGNAPCALNAANEVAVAAFLQDKISFAGIAQTAEHCLQRCHAVPHPSLEDYMETDRSVREIAAAFVENGASPRQNFASLIQNTASPIPNIA